MIQLITSITHEMSYLMQIVKDVSAL